MGDYPLRGVHNFFTSFVLQKVETEADETRVILYYDKLTRSKTCPNLMAFKSHQVDQMQDGLVKVYDYYDPCELLFFSANGYIL